MALVITKQKHVHAYIIVAPPNVEIKNKPGSGEIVAEEGSRLELQCAVSLERRHLYILKIKILRLWECSPLSSECKWNGKRL